MNTYEFKLFDDGNSLPYYLALPVNKGMYTSYIAAQNKSNVNGLFAVWLLKGAGTLIDVGANIGTTSIPAAVTGSNVIAIELLPENCFLYTMAIIKNNLKNVKLFQCAASDSAGIAHYCGHEAWGFVVGSENGAQAVKLTVDDILRLANLQQDGFVRKPVLCKIDTEGHELQTLLGSTKTISDYEPDFLFESISVEGRDSPREAWTLKVKEMLSDLGYSLYLLRGMKLIPQSPKDIQYGYISDYFATKTPYKYGDKIGDFIINNIHIEEQISSLIDDISQSHFEHRMHAAGVAARLKHEGVTDSRVDDILKKCLADSDQSVVAHAQKLMPNT